MLNGHSNSTDNTVVTTGFRHFRWFSNQILVSCSGVWQFNRSGSVKSNRFASSSEFRILEVTWEPYSNWKFNKENSTKKLNFGRGKAFFIGVKFVTENFATSGFLIFGSLWKESSNQFVGIWWDSKHKTSRSRKWRESFLQTEWSRWPHFLLYGSALDWRASGRKLVKWKEVDGQLKNCNSIRNSDSECWPTEHGADKEEQVKVFPHKKIHFLVRWSLVDQSMFKHWTSSSSNVPGNLKF